MKSVKSFAIVALVAIVAVACGKVEKILPKKDGLWVGTSQTVASYVNDSLTSTVTETDSLGQAFFEKDGTGYSADFQGNNKVDFTWSVNDDNDKITLTDTSGFAVIYDILESSNKAQKWFGTISITVGSDVYKTEITSEMERAE
jgi:hypothetical protein